MINSLESKIPKEFKVSRLEILEPRKHDLLEHPSNKSNICMHKDDFKRLLIGFEKSEYIRESLLEFIKAGGKK